MVLILEFSAQQEIGGTQSMAVGGAAVIVSLVGRAIARAVWRRLVPPEVALVIGDGELAASIRRKLELFPDMHLTVAGREELREVDGYDVVEQLAHIGTRIDRLIVASDRLEPDFLARVAARCRELAVKLNVVSPLRGRASPAPTFSRVADLRVFEYDTSDVPRSTRIAKRTFDMAVASAVLLVTLPLLPLIALAIKLDSRGSVFFKQLRAGRDGRPFVMLKFRTMTADAEERLHELIDVEDLAHPAFKLNGDPRVTRVGRFLRRFSLDEVPQLVNVLRGEMSIVGPRPEEIDLVRRYAPEHRFRLNVKPGITGPMQVYGRGELSFPERLAVELDYVENLSLGRDLTILARTLPAVLRGTGAY
jgi:exopolysaccharide biosynthesis polyprenyl glycosylphosphotransferase